MNKLKINLKLSNKLPALIVFALLASAFILLIFSNSSGAWGVSSSCCNEKNYKSESIYQQVNCNNCNCFNVGRKMLSFQGMDAECEKESGEFARILCYNNFSYANFQCEGIPDKDSRNGCYAKYRGSAYNYYTGGSGTLINRNEFLIQGWRTYFDGFNQDGQHKILTGFDEAGNTVMTFRKNSRDLEAGNDVSVRDNIKLLSSRPAIYFGSNPIFDEISSVYSGGIVGITEAYRGNALRIPIYRGAIKDQLVISSNYHDFIALPSGKGKVKIEKGMEVDQDLKTDKVKFIGKDLLWSEPIRGNFILYYKK